MKLRTYANLLLVIAPFSDGDVLAADLLSEFSFSAGAGDVWRFTEHQSNTNTEQKVNDQARIAFFVMSYRSTFLVLFEHLATEHL